MPIMQCLLVAYVYIIFTQMYHIVVLNKVANKNRENTNILLSKRQ